MNEFRALGVCLAIAAMLGASAVGAQDQVRDSGRAPYVSGGVGEESRAWLEQQAAQFNVRVIFALKTGEYLCGVDVVVADASGSVVFTTVSDGPWLYAKLAPGKYQMRATFAGQIQTQTFAVTAQASRQFVFRWEDTS